MAESRSEEQRLVLFSGPTALDLAIIHTYTTQQWGLEQAERYTELIKEAAYKVANNVNLGRPLDDFPGLFSFIDRWPRAQHCHYVIYQPTGSQVVIVRILHSAMDVGRHLGPSSG